MPNHCPRPDRTAPDGRFQTKKWPQLSAQAERRVSARRSGTARREWFAPLDVEMVVVERGPNLHTVLGNQTMGHVVRDALRDEVCLERHAFCDLDRQKSVTAPRVSCLGLCLADTSNRSGTDSMYVVWWATCVKSSSDTSLRSIPAVVLTPSMRASSRTRSAREMATSRVEAHTTILPSSES